MAVYPGGAPGLDSLNSFGNEEERQANLKPILEKAKTSQARKRRRQLERRSSVPRGPGRAWAEND